MLILEKGSCITKTQGKLIFVHIQITSSMPAPQGINGLFDFRKITPEELDKQTDALIAKQRAAYNSVGSLPLDQVKYDNVIKVRMKHEYQFYLFIYILYLRL